MIKNLLIAILAFGLISCGGEKSAEQGENHDAAEHDHDSMEMAEASDDMFEITEGQRVYFVNLNDGDQVTSPFIVEMGVEGMEVEPAGENHKNKGHHHILIGEEFTPAQTVVAADSTHIHFGKGQTETELDLAPGTYTISLQFANGFHQSYGEKMSASIQIEVIEE